jgi:hypothetical protein
MRSAIRKTKSFALPRALAFVTEHHSDPEMKISATSEMTTEAIGDHSPIQSISSAVRSSEFFGSP